MRGMLLLVGVGDPFLCFHLHSKLTEITPGKDARWRGCWLGSAGCELLGKENCGPSTFESGPTPPTVCQDPGSNPRL